MATPTTMTDLSVTAASNSPAGSESPTNGDDFLRAIQAIVRRTNAKGSDIASATTTDIGAATAEFVDVTGTTTITGLGTIDAGIVRTVRFTGALTLTHNATSLILPGGANITTAANSIFMFRSLGSGNWICVGYLDPAGFVKISSLQNQTYTYFTTGGTSTAYTLTPTPAITSLVAGQKFSVNFNATAGATPTLAISGLTAKNLKVYDSAGAKVAASATTIIANMIADVIYDGTDYVVFTVLSPATTKASLNTQITDGNVVFVGDSVITEATPVTTTSGTAVNFTDISTSAKRITVNFSGVSTNGTSLMQIQIGDSGGIEATGYSSYSTVNTTNSTSTTGFLVIAVNASTIASSGSIILSRLSELTWCATGCVAIIGSGGGNACCSSGGVKTLSAAITQLTITMVNGTDAFDAGAVNILIE